MTAQTEGMKIDHQRIPLGSNDWQRKRETDRDRNTYTWGRWVVIPQKYKFVEREIERNGLW